MEKKMKKWLLLVIVTTVGFFLDWFTKHLAHTNLTFATPVPVIGDYLQLLLVYNKGALFGFNPQSLIASFPVNHFFIVFTFLAVIMLIFYYRHIPETEVALHWGIMLIFPGAFGNLLDRIIHPQLGVIDFIRIGIPERYYWPIFNFADIYVTVGVVILMIAFITEEKRRKKKQDLKKTDQADSAESLEVTEGSVSDHVR